MLCLFPSAIITKTITTNKARINESLEAANFVKWGQQHLRACTMKKQIV